MTAHPLPPETRDAVFALISSWSETPAFLCDRRLSVVASNRLARALSPAFAEGSNLARFVFLEPGVDRSTARFDDAVAQIVGLLRAAVPHSIGDAVFQGIVDDLTERSPDFVEAWCDGDATSGAVSFGSTVFATTPVGRLHLDYLVLRIPDNADDRLFVWVPHTAESTSALERLSALTTGDRST